MFIEKVTIKGIRSFRDETVIEDVYEGLSAIVGKDGIDKNDFILALGLIFNVQYFELPRTLRAYFLTNEIGKTSQRTGYVEVVINIEGNRILTNLYATDAVSFRRAVWVNKHEFKFNGDSVSGEEVKKLFKMFGFASCFFVSQGQINEFASQNPSQRALWLKEMAGASEFGKLKKKYKTRLTQQLKRQSKWKMEFAEKKIGELREEANLVYDYNEYRFLAGTIEFVLCTRELRKLRICVGHIEDQHCVACKKASNCFTKKDAMSANCKILEKRERSNETVYDSGWFELNLLMEERSHHLKNEISYKLRIDGLRKVIAEKTAAQEQYDVNLDEELASQKKALSECTLVCDELKVKEQELYDSFIKLEEDRKNLCIKAAILREFATVDQRDAHIRHEIETYTELKNKSERVIGEVQERLRIAKEKEIGLKQKSENRISEAAQHSDEKLKNSEATGQLENRQLNLVIKISKCHRTMFVNEEMLATAKRRRRTLEREVFPYSYLLVSDELTRMMEENFGENLAENYKGLVIENLDCPEELILAVENVAGEWLFHMIVKTTKFAMKVIKLWNREGQEGRLEFIALDRLNKGNNATLPCTIPGATPLIDYLDFSKNPFMKDVMCHIFGRTMLCNSVELCFELAKNKKFNCVTLDGDGVSARGLIFGGSSSEDPSRLKAYTQLSAVKKTITELTALVANEKAGKASMEAEVNKLTVKVENLYKVDFHHRMCLNIAEDKSSAVASLTESKKDYIMQLEAYLETLKNTVCDVDRRLEFLSQGFSRDPNVTLTPDEQNRSGDLADRLNIARRQYSDTLKQRKLAVMKAIDMKHSIIQKLRHKIDTQAKSELEVKDLTQQLNFSQQDHDLITLKIAKIGEIINECNGLLWACIEEKGQVLVECNAAEACSDELGEMLVEMDFSKGILQGRLKRANERYKVAQKRLCKSFLPSAQRLSECRNVPDEELREEQQFFEKMVSTIGASNLNFRAPGHLENKNSKFKDLKSTFENLFESFREIRKLVDFILQKNISVMIRTVHQVRRHFVEIFTELVPRGKANMEIKEDEALLLVEDGDNFNRFTGIYISASFDVEANGGQLEDIQHFTGGRKWLIALAFLFAVQYTDPAHFYIFEDIDQHVDDANINSLAEAFVREMFKETQVMMGISRRPMLDTAVAFFGITTENGTTKMAAINKQNASSILTGQ